MQRSEDNLGERLEDRTLVLSPEQPFKSLDRFCPRCGDEYIKGVFHACIYDGHE